MSADRQLPVADRASVRIGTRRLLAAERGPFTVVIALFVATALAGLIGPWTLGQIAETVRSGGTLAHVDRLALVLGAGIAARILLGRAASYASARFGERTVARLRERFIDRTLSIEASTVERAGTGDLMTRATTDVTTVARALRDAVPEVLLSSIQVVFILVAVFLLHPLLGLCALVGTPAMLAGARWYLRRSRPAYLAQGAAESQISELLSTTVEGAGTIRAMRLEQQRLSAADRTIDTAIASRVRTLWLRTVFFPTVDLAHALPVASLLLIGGYAYLHGHIALGAVVAGAAYLNQLVDPLDGLMMWLEQVQRGSAALARVLGVEQIARPTPTGGTPVNEEIQLRGVRYGYPDGPDVLHGIDLAIRPGETLAVVGPSGAGKSTLARLLAGLEAPRVGAVEIGGVSVTDLPLEVRHRQVALVTQEHHVFLGSLRDNLILAAPDADDGRLLTALADVDAHWATQLPDGLDTEVGATGTPLTPAQAQQVALARLVLADPHTLILDEATSLLDPRTARQAERSLGAVLHGRTVVAVAHRLSTAQYADRIAVMEAGRITELGTHDELLAAGGAYSALWHAWHG